MTAKRSRKIQRSMTVIGHESHPKYSAGLGINAGRTVTVIKKPRLKHKLAEALACDKHD